MLQFLYGLMSVLLHVLEPSIILIININGRVAAPLLLLVAGTLRGHLGWWWARWSRAGTRTLSTLY